jgi:hypothetical protein
MYIDISMCLILLISAKLNVFPLDAQIYCTYICGNSYTLPGPELGSCCHQQLLASFLLCGNSVLERRRRRRMDETTSQILQVEAVAPANVEEEICELHN